MKTIKKHMQVDILRRFMSEDELQRLLEKYSQNRKSQGSVDRLESLKNPIGKENIELLDWYVNQSDVTIGDKAKELGMSSGQLFHRTLRAGMRALYQLLHTHPDLIKEIK